MTLTRFPTGNTPTTAKRLEELTGVFEVATTDGELSLSSDHIGDVYQWLLWIQQVALAEG